MNPPLTELSDTMYRELRADLRGLQQSVESVHKALDDHVQDEMGVHRETQQHLSEVREAIATLRTKQGAITAGISAAVAALVAWGGKVFFY
jgi:hypothetical protein